jgi:hypothetical protein
MPNTSGTPPTKVARLFISLASASCKPNHATLNSQKAKGDLPASSISFKVGFFERSTVEILKRDLMESK